MKLRNKKTGEIAFPDRQFQEDSLKLVCENTGKSYTVKTLAKLNEEWEDYEEPKRHWIIDTMNDRVEDFDVPMAFNESIGNYFGTREEAEKAVEKLKAWKRLKDAGFKFKGFDWRDRGTIGDYEIYARVEGEVCSLDLDLLFGGEE